MKLSYIRPGATEDVCVLGLSGEGETLRIVLPRRVYLSAGAPVRGEELSDEVAELFLSEAKRREALRTALSVLSYGDNSRRMLYTKLKRKGYDKELCLYAVREAVGLGYIDERRQLERLIPEMANRKLYGPGRILSSLLAKGYEGGQIEEVLASLEADGTVDLDKNRALLLEKKRIDPLDTIGKKKVLYTFGYKK